MEKVLVTGGSGLLGSNVAKTISSDYEVYATYGRNKASMPGVEFFGVDLTQKKDLGSIVEIKPDLIIHCAALVNVDYCEKNPGEARSKNVVASINVAEAAKECGSKLIHISTDAVFDGVKGDYSEDDAPNPVNVYGKTKLEAEENVLSILPGACVVRTNIYGWNKLDKKSLAEWMIKKLEDKEVLTAFGDVFVSPILVNDLVAPLLETWRKDFSGILHIAGGEKASKLEFAHAVADVFGLDHELIKAASVDDAGLSARRGKDLSLDVSKAERVLGLKLPGVKEGLKRMKDLLDNGYLEDLKNG